MANWTTEANDFVEGLTIREHFAAVAMQGLLSGNPGMWTIDDLCNGNLAAEAVGLADQLIVALNRQGEVAR